jgi:thiamine monophosphate synthase
MAFFIGPTIGFMLQSPTVHRILMEVRSSYDDAELASASQWKRPPYLALITEPDACDSSKRMEESFLAIERATRDGNVDLVVVRTSDDVTPSLIDERNANKLELLHKLSQLKLSREKDDMGFKIVVNNDLDMTITARSQNISIDGIHVKERNIDLIPSIRQQLQDSIPQSEVANEDIIIGTSCHSLQSAMSSYQFVNYLFVGTCYMTQSHPEKEKDQLEGPAFPGRIKEEMTRIFTKSTSRVPIVFAIGGIDETNCHEPVQFGADGVGVIRSVMRAGDPQMMAKCIIDSMSALEKEGGKTNSSTSRECVISLTVK